MVPASDIIVISAVINVLCVVDALLDVLYEVIASGPAQTTKQYTFPLHGETGVEDGMDGVRQRLSPAWSQTPLQ